MGANVPPLINIHRPAKIMILHSFLFNHKMTVLTCDYCVEDRKDIKKVFMGLTKHAGMRACLPSFRISVSFIILDAGDLTIMIHVLALRRQWDF